MADIIERVPPQSREAEQSVIGSMMVDRDAIAKVIEILAPQDFYFPAHRDIYEGIQDLYANNKPIDMITVGEWLRDREMLDKIGGISYLADLAGTIPITANVDAYAHIVEEKSLLRQLIQAGQQVVTLAYEEDQPIDDVLDKAEKIIFGIGQRRGNQDLTHIQKIIADTFGNWDDQGEDAAMQQVASAFVDLDTMLGGGMGRSDLIVLAARPAMGKCASFDSLITLADGSVQTIQEISRRQKAALLTLHEDWQFKVAEPSAFIDDGIKPVFKVTTRLGRQIETTITHPYLTIGGWQPLSQLATGTRIAVPRRIAIFGNETMRSCDIQLLAFLIGDGCLTDSCPEFTNSNPVLQQTFTQAVSEFGPLRVRMDSSRGTRTPTLHVAAVSGRTNPLTQWLRSLGLWGKTAHGKFVPEPIFRLPRTDMALFLNRLFATDGWASVLTRGQAQLGYCSVSERLTRQVQHLLLRFGIIAALKKRSVKYKDSRRTAWQLDITDPLSIRTFISEIGIFGKEQALDAVLQTMADKSYHSNKDLIPIGVWNRLAESKGVESWSSLARRAGIKGHTNIHPGQRAPTRERLATLAAALQDTLLHQLSQSDIYWDEIVSIEYTGEKQVYDLTIPETHNFVANDICVHNTALALNIACKVAQARQLPVAIFSLEMSKEQLMQRLLCLHGRLSSLRLRSRNMSAEEFKLVNQAAAELSTAPIYIDDSSSLSAIEIRAKSRRLKAEVGEIGLIIIDYLQLMEANAGRNDNRVQEISQITRNLKGLARELRVPVLALSQLSRKVEERTDKRPMLSDLRESGCLTGDTPVYLPDQGVYRPMAELVGKSGFRVLALNESTWKMEQRVVSNTFATGAKQVFALKTRLGRMIKATANHKFLTISGWRRLDELNQKDRIALPRELPGPSTSTMSDPELGLLGHLIGDGCTLPSHAIQYTTREQTLATLVSRLATEVFGEALTPRIQAERSWYQVYLASTERLTHGKQNPVAAWLRELGVFGLRSHEKLVPDRVFCQPKEGIALFLRHLWATDGCINLSHGKSHYAAIYYASSSSMLARHVQSLLLRVGINATISQHEQPGKGRDQYHVAVSGKADIQTFLQVVGALGEDKTRHAAAILDHIPQRPANTNRDVVSREIWRQYAIPAMQLAGVTTRAMQAALGNNYCGTTLYKQNVSRDRALKLAKAVKCKSLRQLAESDVYWDEIIAIEPAGEAEVFDLTVEGLHNFVAGDIIAHNSIEQDSDVVLFIYRDDYYHPADQQTNLKPTELIVAKHRNGPTGKVYLMYQAEYTRFENASREGIHY